MNKSLLLFLSFLLAALIFTSQTPFIYADAPNWWDVNWDYRKSHIINSATDAGTNYPIEIITHYGSGSDSGNTVYLDSHSQPDFDDVRFIDIDNSTELDYWREEYYAADNATFWVEVQDDLSSVDVTIWIYYGNTLVSTTSNGPATFIFFEDFNTLNNGDLNGQNAWTAGFLADVQTGTVKEGAKAIQIGQAYPHLAEHAVTVSGEKCFLQVYIRTNDITTGGYPADFRIMEDASIITAFGLWESNSIHLRSAAWDTIEAAGIDTWYKAKIALDSISTHKIWIDDDEKTLGDSSNFVNVVTAVNKIQLQHFSGACYAYFDLVIVGKYVDPEPTHGSWGNEEGRIDAVFPTFNYIGLNSTLNASGIQFTINLSDNVELDTCLLEWNNTGSFANVSYDLSGTTYLLLANQTLHATEAVKVEYRFYWNDTSGNMNQTELHFLITNTEPIIGPPPPGLSSAQLFIGAVVILGCLVFVGYLASRKK